MTQSTVKKSDNTSQGKELSRSVITDEWMATALNAESLSEIAAMIQTDHGFDVLDRERDGVFQPGLIKDKSVLVGVPFIVTRWRFNSSDKYKDEEGNDGTFASVEIFYEREVRDEKGRSVKIVTAGVFNDGSTGIKKQLEGVTKARMKSATADPYAGLGMPKGLTVSEYQRDNGEWATTYYLNFAD